jgi:type I restriction enzyme, S subunit
MHKPLRTVLSFVQKEDLPPDWTLVAVGDVLLGTQYGMNCPSMPDGTTSIVGMKDIQDGHVLSQRLAKTNVSEDELETYRLRRGDLLLNRTNSLDQVGKVGLVDADRDDVFASYLVRLNVNTALIEPEYLNYWLNSDLAQRTIKRIATPAIGQANVNPTEFQKYCLVPLPPRPQRLRIVELLRVWDDAIDATKALIVAKKRWLSWVRSELLTGKRRLPGFRTNWRKQRLGEVLTEHKLKSAGSEEVFSVSVHKGLVNQIEHLGRSYAAKDTTKYNRVKPGDIVYTKSPTGEFPLGIIKKSTAEDDVIVSPLYGVFTPTTPYLGEMLDALFESPINTQNYLAPLVQKGAKNTIAITNTRFLEGQVSMPADVDEQEALADIIKAARAELKCLSQQVLMFDRQKRGLIGKLLTGQWQLSVRDSDVDAMAAGVAEEAAQ